MPFARVVNLLSARCGPGLIVHCDRGERLHRSSVANNTCAASGLELRNSLSWSRMSGATHIKAREEARSVRRRALATNTNRSTWRSSWGVDLTFLCALPASPLRARPPPPQFGPSEPRPREGSEPFLPTHQGLVRHRPPCRKWPVLPNEGRRCRSAEKWQLPACLVSVGSQERKETQPFFVQPASAEQTAIMPHVQHQPGMPAKLR